MTDDEVDAVAAELAKAGGLSWHAGDERGPLKLVMDRFRDRARAAIAALDRHRAGIEHRTLPNHRAEMEREPKVSLYPREAQDTIEVGSMVLYQPPGDQRTYVCRVQKLEGSHAYLLPEFKTCTGWVDIDKLTSASNAALNS
jgi:hypothetical protein